VAGSGSFALLDVSKYDVVLSNYNGAGVIAKTFYIVLPAYLPMNLSRRPGRLSPLIGCFLDHQLLELAQRYYPT
jgi:hypothetical protein